MRKNLLSLFIVAFAILPIFTQSYQGTFDWTPNNITNQSTFTIGGTDCASGIEVTLSTTPVGFRRNNLNISTNDAALFGGNTEANPSTTPILVTLSFSQIVTNLNLCIDDLDLLMDGTNTGFERLSNFSIFPNGINNNNGLISNAATGQITANGPDRGGCLSWDNIATTQISFTYERGRPGFSMFLTDFGFDCECAGIETDFDWVTTTPTTSDTERFRCSRFSAVDLTVSTSNSNFQQNQNTSFPVPSIVIGSMAGSFSTTPTNVVLSFSNSIANPVLTIGDLDVLANGGVESLSNFNIPPSGVSGGLILNTASNTITVASPNQGGEIYWNNVFTNEISFDYNRNRPGFAFFLEELCFSCSGGPSFLTSEDDELQRIAIAPIPNVRFTGDNDAKEAFSIWPNPVSNDLQVVHNYPSSGQTAIYNIYSQSGETLITRKAQATIEINDVERFDISELPSGNYIITFEVDNSTKYSKVFIKH